MAKTNFTASAEADLLDLWLFIAEGNLLAADNVADSIYRSAQLDEPPLWTMAEQLRFEYDRQNMAVENRGWLWHN